MASSQFLRYILSAEFALGGQARVTPALTPQINTFVLNKADGFFRRLSLIPGHGVSDKTKTLGIAMCVVAVLFAIPQRWTTTRARIGTAILGGTLSTILLIGEASINGDIWLPAINIGFAGWLVYKETR